MRLIDVQSLELSEFFGSNIPCYAILSHWWGSEEVKFQEWQKQGFSKILGACRRARRDGYQWLWVDTNCIDKTSSAELTEAINSMYQWYAGAGVCFAYLADIGPASQTKFEDSKWFTRGLTLQELVALKEVVFYNVDWVLIGAKSQTLTDRISRATGIEEDVLLDSESSRAQSIAQRMSWLARRQTTRIEDMAYCMLGLFDINMPLLYGEGSKAFTRLQEDIIKLSTDHTIFCWEWTSSVPKKWVSLLAPVSQLSAPLKGTCFA
ncbi:heterokaryon incompatibility protein-domain-containing protein [Immersiella caudata]|uniref:Heterokaryon incompatibility protein-domain-containing protein n=1 Tax=Immersiella caudata TaxID=314043 RepID=A0AA39XI93_9PEZI|nr:heterokaryon incompatibility protein-domain-containing protein [Immersiella caudata]